MSQTSLFAAPRADADPIVLAALAAGAVLSVSVSGGKDSQAMLSHLVRTRRAAGWPGPAEIVHADLNEADGTGAEWPQTPAHVEATARETGWPLVVVRRGKGGLVSRIEERAATLAGTGKPIWPSAAMRYCTSDLKRGPVQKHLRTHGRTGTGSCTALVVSAMGMRAGESHARAKRPVVAVDTAISANVYRGLTPADALARHLNAPAGRLVLSWQPLHDWGEADVWAELDTSAADLARRRTLHASGHAREAFDGWRAHIAYILGNARLSCALCVLGSRSDLVNGARHNPALAARYADLEAQTGYTFRADLSIADVIAEAALDEQASQPARRTQP